MVLHDNRRRKPNLRGTVYSIPKYKGGRQHADILLREDEMMMGGRDRELKYRQKLAERQRMEKDPFVNDGFGAAFGGRMTTATGKALNGNPHQFQHGYGRKNPNASNFRAGRFKK